MLEILKNIPLAQYTTFKIGGPAKEFVSVKNKEGLIEALQYAKKENIKHYVLGGGSNVFFDDAGFNGLVIRMESAGGAVLSDDNRIVAWAGENLGAIVNFASKHGLSGLEDVAGIPGEIGGAVRGNAGAFGTSMGDLVETVEVVDTETLEVKMLESSECKFSYRRSLFKDDARFAVVSVVLGLQPGESDAIRAAVKNTIQKRMAKQPIGWVGSAGSFFENPVVKDEQLRKRFEKETGMKSRDDKIPAGWLINEMGLKGKRIGGIEVNEKNANFVINTGGATAQDVVMMDSFIKQQVRDGLGVQLKEEVEFVGR